MFTTDIEKIMKSDVSRKEKRFMLKLLGVKPSIALSFVNQQAYYTIEPGKKVRVVVDENGETVVIDAEQTVADQIEALMHLYTFGVEIECYNVTANLFEAACITNRINVVNDIYHYNHDDNNRAYKIMSDCSIHGYAGLECVSPILTHENGYNSLKGVCDTLNSLHALVNRSTGLHVHVGGNITDDQYVNTFVNYYWLENLITSWLAPSRANNCYCRRLTDRPGLLMCNTPGEIRNHLHSRYFTVNAEARLRHGTIEFRQHQGSTEYEKIAMWARFCIKLVAWSESNKLTNQINSVDEIPFLNSTEKAYFQERKNHFANMAR